MAISTLNSRWRVISTIILSVTTSVIIFLVLREVRTNCEDLEVDNFLMYLTLQAWLMPFLLLRKDISFSERTDTYEMNDLIKSLILIVVLSIGLPVIFQGLDIKWILTILICTSLWAWLNSFLIRKGEYLIQGGVRLLVVLVSYGFVLILIKENVVSAYISGLGLAMLAYWWFTWRRGFFQELNTGLIKSRNGFARNNVLSTFSYLSQTHLPVLIVPILFRQFDLYTVLISLRILAFPFTSISSALYSRSFSLKEEIKSAFRFEILPLILILFILYSAILLMYEFFIKEYFHLSYLPFATLVAWSILYVLRSAYNSYVRLFYANDFVLERSIAISMLGALATGILLDYMLGLSLILTPIVLSCTYLFAFKKMWKISQ